MDDGSIQITCEYEHVELIRSALRNHLKGHRLVVERSRSSTRATGISEAAILVAAVTASGTVLAAIISGLFALLQKKGGSDQKIIIVGANGARIEFPLGLSEAEISNLVEKAVALGAIEVRVPK